MKTQQQSLNANHIMRKLCALVFVLIGNVVLAQTISVQGVLRDPNGRSVDDGFHNITFKIYDQAVDGTALWSENYPSLETVHGVFQANLGANTPFGNLAFDTTYYVGVTVDNYPEMSPRIILSVYPYARAILGQENKFPSTGDIEINRDDFVLKQGEFRFEGPDGRIVFNDGTSINSADFGGPASALLNPSSIFINADNDNTNDGSINLQIGGQDRAILTNSGNFSVFGPEAGEGAELQLHASDEWDDVVSYYYIDVFEDDFRISGLGGASTGFKLTDQGRVGIGYSGPTSRLHVGDFNSLSLTSGGAFTLGDDGSSNMAFDDNDIQVRNNGAASVLWLNTYGGNVEINAEDTDLAFLGVGKEDQADRSLIALRGAGSGVSGGGSVEFFTSADHDDVINAYYTNAFEDDFRIGGFGYGDMMGFTPEGRVGIGVVPTSRFHVSNFSSVSLGAGSGLTIGNDDNLNLTFDGGTIQGRNNGSVSALNLNYLGGDVTVGYNDLDNAVLSIGQEDVSGRGVLSLKGSGAGSIDGGVVDFMTSADYDDNVNYYYIAALEDKLKMGSVGNTGVSDQLVLASNGNVGIGTADPVAAKLQIEGSVLSTYNFFHAVGNTFINESLTFYSNNPTAYATSLQARERIVGAGFNTFSDRRIKKNLSISNSSEDLEIIKSIEITNYKKVDTLNDNKNYKKVIAQQVNSVYPNAVNQTQDFIPNVYALASGIKNENGTMTISLEKSHSFKIGDAVKLIVPGDELIVSVSAIKNERSFSFNFEEELGTEVFVFGKQVNDLMMVDYEAISMLNVSATQELARQLEEQKNLIEELKAENTNLKAKLKKVDELEAKLNVLLGIEEDQSQEASLVGKQ